MIFIVFINKYMSISNINNLANNFNENDDKNCNYLTSSSFLIN